MRRRRLVAGAAALGVACLMWTPPDADADDGLGGPGGGPVGGNLSPAAGAPLLLCPGVGAAANVLGGGGGYCDFNFSTEGHIHCEWGGFNPIVAMWHCWRVFPGQPDHPALPDPDIIPDGGWGVPWAIRGPSPGDQWPPAGLTPPAPPPP